MIARSEAGVGGGLNDLSEAFVAGNKRISHAREGWHGAEPEQFLGASRNAGIGDVYDEIPRPGVGQTGDARRDGLGPGHYDDLRFHYVLPV